MNKLMLVFGLVLASALLICGTKTDNGKPTEPPPLPKNATYLVYCAKYIRPEFPIQMVVEIFNSTNPVKFTASLSSPAKEIMFELEKIMTEGDTQLLEFSEVIPIGYDGTTDFTLDIKGMDTVTDEILFSKTTSDFVYKSKSLSIFIQTDKGIYKPSQTIKFRAVVTTPDLLPYTGTVDYELIDPDTNKVFQKKDVTLVHGVAGSEFTLGRYATKGDWKIVYKIDDMEEFVTVAVEHYVLPKFEVKVETDQSFLSPESKTFSGSISAEFTFGQPVKGKAKLTFQAGYAYRWYSNYYREEKYEIDYEEFDGKANFNFTVDDVREKLNIDGWYRNIHLVAKVTDKTSSVELEDSTTVDFKPMAYKTELMFKPESVKPGFLYTAYLKVTLHDESLLSKEERDTLGLNVVARYGYPYQYYHAQNNVEDRYNITIQSDGFAVFQFTAHNDNFTNIYFDVKSDKYPNEYWSNWYAERFESPSGIYIQLVTSETSLNPGQKAAIDVRTNAKDKEYTVTMLARGKIVKKETFVPSDLTQDGDIFKFEYEFMVTKDMAPSLIIVILTMGENGEIIADSISLQVEYSLSNPVSILTNVERTETGEPVEITINASPDSFVALRAIDRSVMLQKEGNDITTDGILEELDSYSTSRSSNWRRFYFYWSVAGKNAKDIFQKTGFIVLTDGAEFIAQTAGPVIDYGIEIFDDERMPIAAEFDVQEDAIMFKGEGDGTVTSNSPAPPKTRKDFPETWIWEQSNVGDSGSKVLSYTLPDTATTWEISAFAISDQTGLGVAEPDAQIIATRNFFILMNLPATVVNGEVLHLSITVFNFYSDDLATILTLEINDWFELVQQSNNTDTAENVKEFKIPSQDGYTTSFPIRFLKSGNAIIKATAYSELAADAVERILLVKPEGVENDLSKSSLIERSNVSEAASEISFPVNISDNAVDGSVYGKIYVSGNILGNTMNNLGNLLRMPTGCGEQTMISFAPDVYVSLYLKKVGLLDGKVAQKSRKHIQAGYQNELRYQHTDGGFSAFGESDKAGSTWLTSFVVKCFISAMELSDDLVEEDKIEGGIQFLLNKLQKDGHFIEDGEVHHTDMQGGVSSHETMTAYVLIALTEEGYSSSGVDMTDAITSSRSYLEEKATDLESKETFSLAIMAYALALAGSDKANDIVEELELRASEIKNLKFWKKDGKEDDSCGNNGLFMFYCIPEASSSDIEITSYILLTLMKLDRTDGIMSIVRWLVSQRNNLGGYRSTQDTVMAIQALATYAGQYANRDISMDLVVSHSGNKSFNVNLNVNNENSMLLQSVELPPLKGDVLVSATGIGFADVQVAYQYNTPKPDPKDEPFIISVKFKKVRELELLEASVCVSINTEKDEPVQKTGMLVFAMQLPSGYTVDDQNAANSNTKAKLVELDGGEISGYYDGITTGDELCMTLNLDRYAIVEEAKAQPLRAFSYYEPETSSSVMYCPPSAKVCGTPGGDCMGCRGHMIKSTFLLLAIFLSLIAAVMPQ